MTTIRKARRDLNSKDPDLREAITQELTAIASAEITDVLSWDKAGRVELTAAEDLSPRIRKAIKKVKVVPGKMGTSLEVEMHDKIAPLRLLAKHTGMLDGTNEQNKPSVIGINLRGPEIKEIEVSDDKLDRSDNSKNS